MPEISLEESMSAWFIAFRPDPHFKEVFEEYHSCYSGGMWARFVRKEDLHLTVLHIGHVPSTNLWRLQVELLTVAQNTKPFELFFKKMRTGFPGYGGMRDILIAHFTESRPFTALGSRLLRACRAIGIEPTDTFAERKVPHVTLARNVVRRALTLPVPLERGEAMQVTAFELLESWGSAEPYRWHQSFPLNLPHRLAVGIG
jgi:2'-5' RNA ligase